METSEQKPIEYTGHARARDITILIDMIRKEAMENRGIDLKSEAQVIGDREPQF